MFFTYIASCSLPKADNQASPQCALREKFMRTWVMETEKQ